MNPKHPTRRIHVIGGPGSGKTTLACHLADTIQAPMYDLDSVGYQHGAGAKRSLDKRLVDVHAIASQPAWITEGIFLWWTDALIKRADTIVWLDPPLGTALNRIVTRHVRTSLAGTNKHGGIRALVFFVRNAVRYYRHKAIPPSAPDDDHAVTRAATINVLKDADRTVVRCQRQSDVASLLRSLRCEHQRNHGT